MTDINDQQVSKLLDDIASIKEVISSNRSLMKQMLLPIHFRIVTFVAAFGIIGVSMLYYFLLENYGVYSAIPEQIRKAAIVVVVALWAVTVVLKRVLWLKSVKKVDQQITFRQMIKNLYQAQIFHVWIPILILMFVTASYLYLNGHSRFIIPLTGAGFGIMYNMIGSITHIRQYLIIGYWTILTGLLPLFFPTVSALIFLVICHGCGLLLFAVFVGPKE